MMGFLKRLFGIKDSNRNSSETNVSKSMNSSSSTTNSTIPTGIRPPASSVTNGTNQTRVTTPQNNIPSKKFRALDKVYHFQYGEGTVLESNIISGSEIVTVQFINYGMSQVPASSLNAAGQSSLHNVMSSGNYAGNIGNAGYQTGSSSAVPGFQQNMKGQNRRSDSGLSPHKGVTAFSGKENKTNETTTDKEPVSTLEELFKEDLENVDFTGEFASAFDLMENTNENIIITGKAGTGKSTLLKYFIVHTEKNAVALAPTGVSAINIKGDTIHSFFQFKPKILDESDIKVLYDDKYKNIDTLIIDEFSMVNANLFDAIDLQMRANGKDSSKPFGGAQIIMFGDFFQLPPVVTKDEVAKYFAKEYGSPWFFSSRAFKNSDLVFKVIELQQNHRQGSNEFSRILDNMRLGLQTNDELAKINSRFRAQIAAQEYPIILVTTNKKADEINGYFLNQLTSEAVMLEGTVDGTFPPKSYPTLLTLQLKPGAQVMTLVNDSRHRFVNGTIAKVVSITDDALEIEVKLRGNFYKYKVGKYSWKNYAYRYSPEDHKVVREQIGTFTQFPVRLAWAITVHKSQGLTFNAVTLDIGNQAFDSGQTYVAVSRCRSLEGLSLNSKIKKEDIMVDPYSREFYEKQVLKV